jgi:molecular chaperone GrpE
MSEPNQEPAVDDGRAGSDPRPADAGAADAAAVPEATAAAAAAPVEDPSVLRDRWLRAEAELQNVRRRAAREREEARRALEESHLLELIGVLDDLERALDARPGGEAPEPWMQGVRLVAGRIRDLLARAGVRVIDPLGEPFDPMVHEALLEAEAPEGIPPGHVAHVVHKGYARGDRALRAARVVVARAASAGGA